MVAWYKVLDFTFVFWRGIWRGSFLQKCFRTSIFPMTILNLCGRPLLLFIVCVSWGRDFESVHCSSLSIYGSARDRRCLVNTSWKLIKIIYTRWACFIYACFMDCVTFSSTDSASIHCSFTMIAIPTLVSNTISIDFMKFSMFIKFAICLCSQFNYLLLRSPRW